MICNVLRILILTLYGLRGTDGSGFSNKVFGFGVQRLTGLKSDEIATVEKKRLVNSVKSETTCAGVSNMRYTAAVIDNFVPVEDQQFWEGAGQRYWVNEELWGGPGFPIFVFIGGEWEESCSTLTSTSLWMYELATQHQGLLVNVEHRFYGESFPTNDSSTANLQFLSADQALADLARLLAYLKTSMNTESSQVITVGGSYSGNLAAWFKVKYPHMSDGSVASSAPLTAQTNFSGYMEVVADSLAYFEGQQCVDAFQIAAESVQALAAQGPASAGYTQLDTDFETCSPMQSTQDLNILLSDLMGNVQGTVQYNSGRPGRINITSICTTMLDTALGDEYARFVVLAGQYRAYYNMSCEDASWADTVAYLSAPENDPNNAGRPWTFQTCNEFGYFQTTDSESQPFHSWTSLDLSFYMELCFAAFDGWTKYPQVDFMNTNYGAMSIAAVNVVFPSGSIDPWHFLGVDSNSVVMNQKTETPLWIVGTSHCADLNQPAPWDIPALDTARDDIAKYVDLWLGTSTGDDDVKNDNNHDDDDTFSDKNLAIAGVTTGVVIAGIAIMFSVAYVARNKRSNDASDNLVANQF